MSFLAALRYEFRMHCRSLTTWIALILTVLFVYSEVIAELRDLSGTIERARENPDLIRYSIETSSGPGKAKLQEIQDMAEHGPRPEYYERMAGTLADRMAIVLSFSALFIAGFAPRRSRSVGDSETAYSSPASSLRMVMQQYLGALGTLLSLATVGFVMTVFQFWRTQAQVGGTWSLGMFVRPLGLLLVPTIVYAAALLLCASIVIGHPTSLVPLYFLYFYLTFRPEKIGEDVRYPLNLGTFIVRWEGHGTALFGPEYPMLLNNRILYLALAVALLAVAAVACERNRRGFGATEAGRP